MFHIIEEKRTDKQDHDIRVNAQQTNTNTHCLYNNTTIKQTAPHIMELTSNSDDTPSPLLHQEQQNTNQFPPPASAQTTSLGRKGHSICMNGILPSRKTKKQSMSL